MTTVRCRKRQLTKSSPYQSPARQSAVASARRPTLFFSSLLGTLYMCLPLSHSHPQPTEPLHQQPFYRHASGPRRCATLLTPPTHLYPLFPSDHHQLDCKHSLRHVPERRQGRCQGQKAGWKGWHRREARRGPASRRECYCLYTVAVDLLTAGIPPRSSPITSRTVSCPLPSRSQE